VLGGLRGERRPIVAAKIDEIAVKREAAFSARLDRLEVLLREIQGALGISPTVRPRLTLADDGKSKEGDDDA
jgi:hypothetical protein